MSDYIVFTVGTNAYALEVAQIERIVQIPHITPVVNAHPYIDGMIVYENKTTKILNFRKVSGMESQEEEVIRIFKQMKEDHTIWIDTLREAVTKKKEFNLTTDPHACGLGKWLNGFTANDPDALVMVRTLMPLHIRLHELGRELLEVGRIDPEWAVQMLTTHIDPVYVQTIEQLDRMIQKCDEFVKYQQKLVIYHGTEEVMAVKVDAIDDIAVVDESTIKQYDHAFEVGSCLKTRGVMEHKGKLVIVIESIVLPKEEG